MSANFRNPNFLLPNEVNMATNPALSEDRHSLYSMDFDGSSFIDISNDVSVSGDCTVSFWFKVPAVPNATPEVIFARYTGSGDTDFLIIGLYLQGVLASNNSNASGSKTTRSNVTLAADTWYHCAVTKVSGVVTNIYIDGTDRAGSVGSFEWWSAGSTDSGFIGQKANSDSLFDGNIDEVAIFNTALTASEVSALTTASAPANIMALNKKPIAYYPLGEQARDNTEWQFPNQVLQSQVFDFDGTDDNVTLSNELSGAGTSSASFWIKRNSSSPADDGGILGLVGSGDTSDYISIALWQGVIQSSVANTTNHKGSTTIAVDTWYHVMVVKNSSATTAIYVNGVAETLSTGGTWVATIDTPQAKIGGVSYSGTSYNFQGEISNVAVWNTDQSANITNIYNHGSPQSSYTVTPKAWYKLNATNTYAGLNPNFHNALSFDGASYIDVGTIASLNSVTEFTVSFWSNFDSGQTNDGVIFTNRVDNNNRITIYRYNTSIYFHINSSGSNLGHVTAPSTGSWVHIAMVYDGSGTANADRLKVYFDGVEQTLTYGGTIPATTGTYSTSYLGARGDGSNGYKGDLSNFSIFNQAISAEDVKYLYNGGTPQTNISFEPTSWWKLDNLTTGIQDSGSASNNGTNSGATEATDSVAVNQWNFDNVSQSQTPNYSSALDFDGNNDYINSSYTLPASTTTFSASMWVNTSSLSTLQGLIGSQDSSSDGYWVSISSNNINFKLNGTTSAASTGSISANTWFHLVVTYDGSTAKTYINNNTPVSNSVTETIDVTADTIIGRLPWTGFYFLNGSISNVAIYNTTLSAADVETLFNIGNPQSTILGSPQAWWKLDSTTITDSSGNGNTGTNNGATEIQTNVWTPRLNGESDTLPSTALVSSDLQFESPYSNFSLDFDGAGNYINTSLDTDSYSSFSVSAWVNGDDVNTYRTVAAQTRYGNWANSSWLLYIEGGKMVFYIFSGGSIIQAGKDTAISSGVWYNIVGTWDGSKSRLYINAVKENTEGTVSSMNTSIIPTLIGAYHDSAGTSIAGNWNGKLDECAIFNKALNQAEISQVYNNGYAADLTSLSPVSWWRLGEDAYFVGNDITIPNQISGAPNGTGAGTQTSIMVANAPGSYASGVGTNLADTDRKGEAPESSANSQSINMIPGDVHPYVPGYVPAQVNNIASMAFDRAAVTQFQAGPVTFGANDFSICFWMRYNYVNSTTLRYSTFFNTQTSGSDDAFTIYTYQNKLSIYSGAESITNDASRPDIPGTSGTGLQPWTHIVLVRTASTNTWQTFANGSAYHIFPSNSASAINYQSRIIELGTNHDDSLPLDGFLDEVAVFDYALSPKQIKEDIYNASTTGKAADLNNNSNLTAPVAWYRMGD